MLSVAEACEGYNEKLSASVDSDINSSNLFDLLDGHSAHSVPSSFDSHPKCEDLSLEFLLLASNFEKNSPESSNPHESLDLLDLHDSTSKASGNSTTTESFSLADLCDERSLDDLCSDERKNPLKGCISSDKLDDTNSPVSSSLLTELLYEDSFTEDDCGDIFRVTETNSANEETTVEKADLNTPFSLLDLYVPSKERNTSSSSDSLSSVDSQSCNKVSKSPDCTDSGYSSDRDKSEQIDLSQAKCVVKCTDAPERVDTQDHPGGVKCPKARPSKTPKKSKPSLFFQTLCCQMKPENSSVAKVPTCWAGFLERKNYWEYFSFDTPSPDDVVAAKQSCISQ